MRLALTARRVTSASIGARLARVSQIRDLPSSKRVPLVGVIDMENKEGTVYTTTSVAEEIEQRELLGIANVVFTGAASMDEIDDSLSQNLEAVLLRRCSFASKELARLPHLKCECFSYNSHPCTAQGAIDSSEVVLFRTVAGV
eukprot:6185868-Pleurochrysis_carterae.AAC.2